MGPAATEEGIDLNTMEKIGQNIQKLSGSENEEEIGNFMESSAAEPDDGEAMDIDDDEDGGSSLLPKGAP